MSYCRFEKDSDVYVLCSGKHMACYLGEGRSYITRTKREMLSYLLGMREGGKRIPERALTRLLKEIKTDES